MLMTENEEEQNSWKIQGSYEDYQDPDFLYALIKWIISWS